jgi:hypothetical protein
MILVDTSVIVAWLDKNHPINPPDFRKLERSASSLSLREERGQP